MDMRTTATIKRSRGPARTEQDAVRWNTNTDFEHLPTTSIADDDDNLRVLYSAIHHAARIKDYTKVKELCLTTTTTTTSPSAVVDASSCFVGPDGWTALHHLCDRRCPCVDVVESCIRSCPEALIKVEQHGKGWTPLHFACRNRNSKEVIKLLLCLYPDKGKLAALKTDCKRRSPLWYAVRYGAPPGIVPMLLEMDPSIILSDSNGQTSSESPMAFIWDSFASSLEGQRALRPYLDPGDPEQDGSDNGSDNVTTAIPESLQRKLQRDPGVLSRWKKANMFLKAVFGFPLMEGNELDDAVDRKWRILHATSAVKCSSPYLFLMACALHPEQAMEVDEGDLYGSPKENDGYSNGESCRQQTALHLAAASNASGAVSETIVVTTLIRLFPNAAHMRDFQGRLPLHTACQYGKDWLGTVKAIFEANPQAAMLEDNEGRLPLYIAAANASDVNNKEANDTGAAAGLDLLFNLLGSNLGIFPRAHK